MRGLWLLMSFYIISSAHLYSQSTSSKQQELESIYSELDSLLSIEEIPLDLLLLADSLMGIDRTQKSNLSVRLSYISQIASAGRTLGVEQFGFSPGVSYYHKSGLLASISGYWNSEAAPSYTMTVATLGYSNYIFKKLGYFITHDFYLYHDTLSYHSFNKSASLSLFTGFKYLDLSVDYAYLYGEKDAHRIYGSVNGVIQWKNLGWIDKISIMPTTGLTFGNNDVINIRLEENVQQGDFREFIAILQSGEYPTLSTETYRKLFLLARERRFTAMGYVLMNEGGYTREQINEITTEIRTEEELGNSFGLMNVHFSLPISIKTKKLNWLVNYTYNIPIELPGENLDTENNGFLSLSLSYYF